MYCVRRRLRQRRRPRQEIEKATCSIDKGGGQKGTGALKRRFVVDVNVALRRWTAPDGVLPLESQGHRFFPEPNTCSSGQRRQRPAYHASCGDKAAPSPPSSGCEAAARARPTEEFGPCRVAQRLGEKIS